MSKPLWALGLMSGTSADGIDGALVQTDGERILSFGSTYFKPYSKGLRDRILKAYGHPPGPEIASLERELTEQHAKVVHTFLKNAPKVDLIGFHGQTLFHNPPRLQGEIGETHIIGGGPLLASLTNLPVVDQFRLNDIAHGGQGAPFVPVFHQALAKDLPKPLVVLNIGGVANITWIGKELLAFDTGPGNGLMDDWIRKYTDLLWDEEGKIAVTGQVNEEILQKWLMHPYFHQKPPKSLDRNTFKDCLTDISEISFENGVATLTAFTAASIEKAWSYFPEKPRLLLVAGGGAYNSTLLTMIEDRVKCPLMKASDKGWNADALEAQAFGFLAVRSLRSLPLSFPGTTGVPYPLTGGRVLNFNTTIG